MNLHLPASAGFLLGKIMSTVDEMIQDVLKKEGGYVNHKNDRGGATNHGITQATLSAYLGHPATISEVKNLTQETAAKIYKKNYYYAPHIDLLPDLIEPIIFDMAINSGAGRAVKILQKALFDKGYPVGDADGVIGKKTILYANEWVNALGSVAINTLVDYRVKFYKKIIANDASQKVFEKGWLARAESFRVIV
jgi:lysozyme family protein